MTLRAEIDGEFPRDPVVAALSTDERNELERFHGRFLLSLEYMIIRMIVKQIITPETCAHKAEIVKTLSGYI